MIPEHESATPSGIVIPDPDQGTAFIRVDLEMGGPTIEVWEPFPDDPNRGHNLDAFMDRWQLWAGSSAPFLEVREPRFGFPVFIPRRVLERVTRITLDYRRKEDTRASHRSLVAPRMRQRADGAIEIQVPR